MAGTRQNNTMSEDLSSLMGQLAQMKLTPDADLGFITNLETQILQTARQPTDQLKALQQVQNQMNQPQSAGMGMAMGSPAIGGAPPMMGGGAMPGPAMAPPAMAGMPPGGMPMPPPGMPPPGIPGMGMAGASPSNPTLPGVRALQGGISRMTPGPGAVDELRRLLGK